MRVSGWAVFAVCAGLAACGGAITPTRGQGDGGGTGSSSGSESSSGVSSSSSSSGSVSSGSSGSGSSSGGFDSGVEPGPLYAPDAGFMSNLYFMSCLTGNAEGDPSKASTWVAKVTYAPESGGGGTITFGNQALTTGASSLSSVTGMYYQASPANAPVAPDGTATVTWGDTTTPGNANPVTMMDLVFSSSSLALHVESETQICGNFSGNLSAPTVTVITGPCVFRLLPNASSAIPSLQPSDFHCP